MIEAGGAFDFYYQVDGATAFDSRFNMTVTLNGGGDIEVIDCASENLGST